MMGWAEETSRQCRWRMRVQSTSVRHQHRRGSESGACCPEPRCFLRSTHLHCSPASAWQGSWETKLSSQHNVSSLYFPPFCENGFSGPWPKFYLWGGKGMRVRSLRSFSDTQRHKTLSQNKQKKKEGMEGRRKREEGKEGNKGWGSS